MTVVQLFYTLHAKANNLGQHDDDDDDEGDDDMDIIASNSFSTPSYSSYNLPVLSESL